MRTFKDLTDKEFKDLHRFIIPHYLIKDALVIVNRDYQEIESQCNIETHYVKGIIITYWIETGEIQFDADGVNFNPIKLAEQFKLLNHYV